MTGFSFSLPSNPGLNWSAEKCFKLQGTEMREEQYRFLSLLGQLPARLTADQVGWLLNCQPHDVPVLMTARLLKPLGSPLPNSVKYFATTEILELAKDRAWLARVTSTVGHYWKQKNLHKKSRGRTGNGPSLQVDFLLAGDN